MEGRKKSRFGKSKGEKNCKGAKKVGGRRQKLVGDKESGRKIRAKRKGTKNRKECEKVEGATKIGREARNSVGAKNETGWKTYGPKKWRSETNWEGRETVVG